MADHVDPAESLVLDYEFLVGLRLENDAGVNSIMVRGQMLRANGDALLVRDATDQQVPAEPGQELGHLFGRDWHQLCPFAKWHATARPVAWPVRAGSAVRQRAGSPSSR